MKINLLAPLLLGIFLVACAHTSGRNPSEEDPWAHPEQLVNYNLYKNEAYEGGSKEAEVQLFLSQVSEVQKAQEAIAHDHKLSEKLRVFHAKTHGCLIGQMDLRADRSPEVFSDAGKQSYTVLVRFSNGVGISRHDLVPDVKGIAIKIFGVTDQATGASKNIDFTMTNSPTPFGKDQAEFIQFMKANIKSLEPLTWNVGHDLYDVGSLPWFFINHPKVARRLIPASLPVSSVVTQRYWAGHAYLLDADKAMKLNVIPFKASYKGPSYEREIAAVNAAYYSKEKDLSKQTKDFMAMKNIEDKHNPLFKLSQKLHANYLAEDLAYRASQYPIQFALAVQLEKDLASTPIEENLVEWSEKDSPSIPMADLNFPPQDIKNSELAALCESVSFSPSHYVSQHRPLSNMGRGRMFTYLASQQGRHAQTDLNEEDILKLKQKIVLAP